MTIAVWARANKRARQYTLDFKWFVSSVLVIVLTGFVYIWLSLQNIELGYRIADAIQIQKRLEEQNRILQLEWSHITSPYYLQKQAEKLGLQRPEQSIKLP